MNLQELWSGNDYAHYPDRGRGEIYRSYAERVKVIRAFKERIPGNERETGYAEVMILDNETGEPKTKTDGSHKTRTVRARDIAMRWEAYAEERAHREAQRERLQREREERERIDNENKVKLREALQTKYQLPLEAIGTIGASSIYLNRYVLEKELGIAND